MKALTGAAAAALLSLDGFRDHSWPKLYCCPETHRGGPNIIRTRNWRDPMLVDETSIAHPSLVLRHLGFQLHHLARRPDIRPEHRIELALEHTLRSELVDLQDFAIRGSRAAGDAIIKQLVRLRGTEPPTESYAETQAAQLFRDWGFTAWRQVELYESGHGRTGRMRADFAIAFSPTRKRPDNVTPKDALLIEVDSRMFHAETFEQDHAKQMTYQLLGFSHLVFTPNQLARTPNRVRAAIEKAMQARRR